MIRDNGSPRRCCEMTFKIGADSYEAMLHSLRNFVDMMGREHPGLSENHSGISGGYDSGYSWDITFDHEMTHERFFELVDEWIEQRKKERVNQVMSAPASQDNA